MAKTILSQNLLNINDEIRSRENLDNCLVKAEALMQIALEDDFINHSQATIHHYLWTINDLVEQARSQNSGYLESLYKSQHKL